MCGLLLSRLHRPGGPKPTGISRIEVIYVTVLISLGVVNLGYAHAPLPTARTSMPHGGQSIFGVYDGRQLAGICGLVGIAVGAFSTMHGPLLDHFLVTEKENLFAPGTGICLFVVGVCSFGGTMLGGGSFCLILGGNSMANFHFKIARF